VPSLLPGIALVYMFGKQGFLTPLLMGHSIYGPIGIVIGSVFFSFPHAFIIIATALSLSDARLHEASIALKASPWKRFLTVTLPGARYGLISAAFVTFTLVITDFGLPKVIGGQFNVLAVDIYKQVIGQQNFEMGAVVSVVLLIPAIIAFTVDRIIQRRQQSTLSARSVPFSPHPNAMADRLALLFCILVAIFIAGILLVCQFAALVKLWPYDLSFGLKNYDFSRTDGGGWEAYFNSMRMALYVALIGTGVVFIGAYIVGKTAGHEDGAQPAAHARHHAACGSGHGSGPVLHLLLQRSGKPAQLPLWHDGDPRHQFHHPFLHGLAPDGRHRAEATRS
jgi:iron(III) transport system permease protein